MATPQFDFFPRDFLASTIGWPAAARGHYITLLCVAWEQDGLPGDPRRVAAISPGLAEDWPEWEEKFPVGDDGRRRNPRLERERAYRMVRSEAGKAGAASRWGENGKNGKRNGKRIAGAIEIASVSHMRNGMANGCGPGGDCAQAESGADLAPELSDFAPPENTGENGKNGKRMARAIEIASVSHMANGMAKRCPPAPAPAPAPSHYQEETPSLRSGDATSDPPRRRKRSQPADSIRWTPAGGWEGITDADRAAWRVAYPACDLARELAAAGEWLRSNPEKSRKSRWRAFLTRWLSRSQDRGGGLPSRPAAGRPDAPMSLDEKIARDRRDAARRPAWRAAPAGCPDDLAGRLFNAMLPEAQYRENLATYRKEMAARAAGVAQEATPAGGACDEAAEILWP